MTARFRTRLWAGALVAVVGAGWLVHARRVQAPAPPFDLAAIDLPELEPQVAAKIRAAREELDTEIASPAAWGRLGQILHAHDFRAAALRCYDRAEALAPGDSRWPYLAGVALVEGGLEDALERFERAAALGPDDLTVHLRLGEALTRAGQTDRAREAYEAALGVDPRSSVALYGLGQLEVVEGDVEAALDHLEEARRLAPEHGEVRALLAQLYRRRGDAIAADREALVAGAYPKPMWPPDPVAETMRAEAVSTKALAERAMSLGVRGEAAAAESLFRRIVEIRPPQATDYSNLGIVLAQQGRMDEAEAEFRAGLERFPQDFELLFNYGTFLSGRGLLDEAGEHLERALRSNPGGADALANLGRVRERQGRLDVAIDRYGQALANDPSRTDLRVRLGGALAAAGRLDEAVASLQRVLWIQPADLAVRHQLARIHASRSDHREAVRLLEEGVEIDSGSIQIAALLAWELATAPDAPVRDGARAVELARQVLSAMPSEARAADLMAAALAESGRFEEALELAEAALSAVRAAGATDLAVAIESRVALYRESRAYRQAAEAPGE